MGYVTHAFAKPRNTAQWVRKTLFCFALQPDYTCVSNWGVGWYLMRSRFTPLTTATSHSSCIQKYRSNSANQSRTMSVWPTRCKCVLLLIFLAWYAQMLLQYFIWPCAIKTYGYVFNVQLPSFSLPPTLLFHPSNMMTLERTPDTTEPPKPAPELELVSLAKLTRNTVQRLAPFCQIRLPCVSLSSSFYSMLDSVYLMV